MSSNLNRDEYLPLLRQRVMHEIQTYVYEFPTSAIGKPWTRARVDDGLAQFQAALVEPYWAEAEIRDTADQVRSTDALRRKCAVVADDRKGILLLFDPIENSFVLAQRRDVSLVTFGVRGDPVGCFLAS